MLKKIVPLILTIALLLSGCGNNSIENNKSNTSDKKATVGESANEYKEEMPYLSITETYYTDKKKEQMKSRSIVYDGKRTKEIGKVPYESSYPLTCYSNRDNCIYYIGDDGKRYQIYKNGEKPYKIPTDFCSFNELYKCGKYFFSLAVHSKCSCMNPILFNSDFSSYKQIIEDPNDDLFCWASGVDCNTHTIYFSSHSDKEDRETLDNPEKKCESTIYSYNLDDNKLKKVYKTSQYISCMAAKEGVVYMLVASTWEMKDRKIIILDTTTGKVKDSNFNIMVRDSINNLEIINDKLYYISKGEDMDGIYSYDLISGKKELILKQKKDEFINGFSLNY